MIDFPWSALRVVLRLLDAVLDVTRLIDDARAIARRATGSDKLVEVPPEPKVLPPAAQRALAEAEERERLRELSRS